MVNRRHKSRNYPSPEYCILDMVNAHLKMNREGRKLTRGVLVCISPRIHSFYKWNLFKNKLFLCLHDLHFF